MWLIMSMLMTAIFNDNVMRGGRSPGGKRASLKYAVSLCCLLYQRKALWNEGEGSSETRPGRTAGEMSGKDKLCLKRWAV